MHWFLVLLGFVLGLLAGIAVVSLCSMAGYSTQSERIDELRVVLGDLCRAVQSDTLGEATEKALGEAERVLKQ